MTMTCRFSIGLSVLLLACGGSSGGPDAGGGSDGAAGDADLRCAAQVYEDVSVPMRDGKELAAFVRHPADASCALPTVLIQTPYDKENARTLWFSGDGDQPLFDSTDYNFVVVDWRGFYGSSGALNGQPNRGEDGYDAVQWIADQSWSDGKVGTWGVSALCRVQHWTAVQQPPALKATVPIFCAMNDTYEQYYPGGVLRREYVQTLGVLFGQSVVEQHPLHDLTWTYAEGLYDAADVKVPALMVAGWFDLDNGANLQTWNQLVASSDPAVRDQHRLLIGAWHHFAAGGESAAGRALTAQELLYTDSDRRIQRDSLAWFDCYLRDQCDAVGAWATVRYQDGGSWIDSATWPPAGASDRRLYLRDDGALVDAAPSSGSLSIAYDPTNPSPTVGGQTLRPDLLHGPVDQGDVLAHAEAHLLETAPLPTPLAVRGHIRVRLAVATTGADTDFAVRLVDDDGSGGHLLVGEGIHRLKLRDSFASVSAVVAGQRYDLDIDLVDDLGYTFAAGHRVGLIVTSSNSPRFERNPNTGDDFYADATTPVSVSNTVFTDGGSWLTLPVGN